MNRRIATAMTIAAALIAPAAAKASPMNDSYAVNVSSASHNLGSYHLEGDHDFAHLFYVGWALDVTSKVTWSGSLPVVTSWNTTNVRQGAALPVSRMAPMLQAGALHVTWGLKGYTVSSSIWKDFDTSTSVDASCAPQLLGSDYECTATSPSVYLARQSGMPNGPYVKLKLRAKFTVTPEG